MNEQLLVIFDWDGTLVDSTDRIVDCMLAAADDLKLPRLEREAIRNIIGLSLSEAITTLYPNLGASEVDSVVARYSSHFVAADKTPCDFFPGAIELLDSLRYQGHKLAVATGKSRRGLTRVLDKLNWHSHFDFTRCGDEGASKPSPDMLNVLLQQSGHHVAAAVMVGDTEFDLAMAHAIDMPRIGVSWGAHSPERLQKWQPCGIADDVRELELTIGSLMG